MQLFATCTRGLEDVSAQEVLDITGSPGHAAPDKVFFSAEWEQVCGLHLQARTLHKMHLLLARGEAEGLDDVAALARDVDWGAWLSPAQSFAVRPARQGDHPFSSMDIGRVVGDAVGRAVARSSGAAPPVDLDAPQVEVTARLHGTAALLGLHLTGESLHIRGYRRYPHPAPLRPTLAAAMLRWASYTPDQGLWDPMCGSATLPIEAAMQARSVAPNLRRSFPMERLLGFPADALADARARALAQATHAGVPLLGTDRIPRHLEGAAENARAAGVLDALRLRALDVTHATEADLPFRPGLVAVNPPFGYRIASKRIVLRLYRRFVERMVALRAPRLVVLVGNPWFEAVAQERGLQAVEARAIRYGELPARLLRYELG